MGSQQINDVDEIMKDLKKYPGFKAYIIMNNEGIVIRWDQVDTEMPYDRAVHHASLVLDLCTKTRTHMQNLFDFPDNQVESIQLRTDEYEMIISQYGNFTLVVIQDSRAVEEVAPIAHQEIPGGADDKIEG
eukprot:CAMPEP_0172421806 /NCGR_PEP_ID=MMETSP1064-20121228/8030_1 /TAXON_ID=202472 /ORGANISM="Aulacoseira subarctica , Strain CCAP 1002/5" /LENGTH=130 /DNA_ID=CAMNT_0013162379 /DNA_START=224 /DNA_END=616 /DNA_ORIENTATION=+